MKKLFWGKVILAENLKMAEDLEDRIVGLMFKKQMAKGEGLLIKPCTSIHTCFMNFPIDVLFIDRDGKILKMIRSLRPWRITGIYFKAKAVIELPSNSLPNELNEGEIIHYV